MKPYWVALPLLAMLALTALLWRGLALDPSLVDSPLIGQPAPRFSLPALHAERVVSEQDFRGGWSLLNVWASWCVSCRAEHEVLVALSRQQPELRIFGLNYKDQRSDAVAWLERLGNPYVESAVDRDGRVGIDYGVYGVPETFVIDASGTIVDKHVGPVTWEWVRERLLPRLAGAAS